MHYSCKCPCPLEQVSDQCSLDCSQFSLEPCCCCCHCDKPKPLVKGKFGLAYVVETPKKKFSKPLGWQVEFEDTPSRIVNNCKKMMKWVNCPPLGDCDNVETNFCEYPEICRNILRDSEENKRQCKCSSSPRNLQPCECIQDDKKCYLKKSKKKSRSPVRKTELRSCSPNCERVCIICENCKINASGCCCPPTLSCYCENSKKSQNARPKNQRYNCDCKCTLGKDDTIEKCCKCSRSKRNDFFQDSNEQCCRINKKYSCKKNYPISDESLDYVPKKEIITRKNRRSPDPRPKENRRERSFSPQVRPRERSLSPKIEQQEKIWSPMKPQENSFSSKKAPNVQTLRKQNYIMETKPVHKENKGTKMDSPKDMLSRIAQTESKDIPKQVDTKPVASTNLIDELQERLKERKDKENEVAPVLKAKEELADKNKTVESANENELAASTNNKSDSAQSKIDTEDMANNLKEQTEEEKPINIAVNEKNSESEKDSELETVFTNLEANMEKPESISNSSGEPVVEINEKTKSDNKPGEGTEEKETMPLLQRIKRAHQMQMDELK